MHRDVVEEFEATALSRPDERAIAWLADGETVTADVTYGCLLARARCVAAHVRSRGAPGDRVLVLHRPGPELAAALFGVLAAGRIAVPVHPPRRARPGRADPTADRWRHVVAGSDPALALADRTLEVDGLPPVLVTTDLTDPDGGAPLARPVAQPIAFLQFTSGSTGNPRGVAITRANLAANVATIRDTFGVDATEPSCTWLPPYHDMGLVGALIEPLVVGMPIVGMPPAAFLQRPMRWLEAVHRHRIAATGGPDFAYALVARTATDAEIDALDLSAWRIAYCGAEPVRAATVAAFAARFARTGFRRTAFVPCYGLAEATLMVTSAQPGEGPAVDGARTSAGAPRPGIDVRIVDPDTLREVDAGDEGEIWVAGDNVSPGYWRTVDPAFGNALDGTPGFLRTGDLGRLVGGELWVTGRRKDVLIVDGRNHAPADLESTASGAHPHLVPDGAAAFSVDRDGREQVVIAVEVRRDRDLDVGAVVAAVRRAVSEQHGVAVAEVVPIRVRTLPRTTSGKVRRAECRRAWVAGELHRVDPSADAPPARPARTGLEARIRDLVADRLGVPADGIPVDRPLAELGLDSRSAVELSGAIGRLVDRELPPTLCWDHPTIAAIAGHLTGATDPTPSRPSRSAGAFAIVGVGCRFPGATGREALLELLRASADAVSDRRPATHPDPDPDPRPGGYLADPSLFDADRFGIGAREAARIDPQQRLVLEVAWEALEDAAIAPDRLAGRPVGVFVGVSGFDWARRLDPDPYAGPAGALAITANRLSYALDLRGPSVALDTACSSSLVALHQAVRALAAGDCDLALVGGVNLVLDPGPTEALAAAGMLSPTGRCHTFDAGADGYVRGEGCGMVVVEPLERAVAAGRPVLAVVRGSAVTQDGRSNGLTAPSGPAQRAAITAALGEAGLSPADLGYVEAHGTGTPLGDPIEWNTLATVLAGRPSGSCAVGSIKANLGHLEAAAGVAGLIKAALSVHHGEIFPHRPVSRPNPALALEGALSLAGPGSTWPAGPRRAGVSSFGFGGTNAHVVLEQSPDRPQADPRGGYPDRSAGCERGMLSDPDNPPEARWVAALSGRRPEDLDVSRARWLAWLEAHPDASVAEVAATMTAGRPSDPHRLAWVAGTRDELVAGLRGSPAGTGCAGPARIAFVYAGQGVDPAGAAVGPYAADPVFRAAVDEGEDVLQRTVGWGVRDVLLGRADAVDARRPSRVQPALVLLAFAHTRRLAAVGVTADAVLGHSVGEYAAAIAAGSLSLAEALVAVAHRGRATEDHALPGAMAAVSAPADRVEAWCRAASARSSSVPVEVAAINGPAHVTVAGDAGAVDRVVAAALETGHAARRLDVGQAYHSGAVDAVLPAFAPHAPHGRPPRVAWFSSRTGERLSSAPPDHWVAQIRAAVRYDAAFRALAAELGPTVLVEIGPKGGLGRLARDVVPDLPVVDASGPWPETLAALWAAGVRVDWEPVFRGVARVGGAPGSVFHRVRCWLPPRNTVPVPVPVPDIDRRGVHPLLGRRDPDGTFASTASLADDPELHDHRAFQTVVVAGASQVSLALAAWRAAVGEGPVALRDVVFAQGLLVERDRPRATRFAMAEDPAGARSFRFTSADPATGAEAVHAVGSYAAVQGVPAEVGAGLPAPKGSTRQEDCGDGMQRDVAAIRARCDRHLDQDAFYAVVARHHIQAGPTYRWCAEAWGGADEALGRMQAPAEAGSGRYDLHPGLVDSAFQLSAATGWGGTRPDDAFILARIGEYRLWRLPTPGEPLWTHAIRAPVPPESDVQRFAIRLLDDRGLPVAEAVDLELRRASLQAVLRSLRPDALDGLFWDVVWEDLPPVDVPRDGGAWWVVGPAVAGIDARPVDPADLEARLREGPAGVLYTAALADPIPDDADADALVAAQDAGCLGLLAVVQAMLRSGAPLRLRVVARGTMPAVAGGTSGPPVHAPLRGLLQGLAAEQPDADVRLVDVGPDVPDVEIVRAVLRGDAEPEIALRADGARVPRLEGRPQTFVVDAIQLDPDAAYVVTGGTGGVGLAVARWLASRGARRLVLVARGSPEGDAVARIAEVRRLGVEVTALAADVGDAGDLGRAWTRIGRPVRGIVHAAGVLADGVLSNQDADRLRAVLRPKLAGTWNLHRVSAGEPLDFFVGVSSLASVLGSPGQAGYSAANAFLDAFAAWRPRTRAVSFGPWADAGMAARQGPAQRAALARTGIRPLDPAVATEVLEQVIRGDRPHVVVAAVDPGRLTRSTPLLSRLTVTQDGGGVGGDRPPVPELVRAARTDPEGARGRIREHVLGLLAEIAGAPVDPARPVQALGLDSLQALDAQGRLKAELGVTVSLTRFLREVAVGMLAEELADEVIRGPGVEPVPEAAAATVWTGASGTGTGTGTDARGRDGLDFSLFFFSRSAEGEGARYELLQDAARFADREGLTAIWLPERHFHPFGGVYPNPATLAASLAPITSRVRLRAGSVVLPLHHPARVAEEWAVVDALSGGRVDLAFVRGWGPNDFVLQPDAFERRTEVLEERVDQVRRLWRGEAVTFPNGQGVPTPTRTWPRPVQPELPVWITCTQHDDRFAAAGRLGANVLTALLLQSPDELARRIALYRRTRAEHGHDPRTGRVTLMLHTYVGEDEAEVRRQVQQPLEGYLASSVDLWKTASAALDQTDPQQRAQILAYAVERYYATSGLFGAPARCAATAARFAALGVDEIACLIDFGVPDDLALASLAHLPAIRDAARALGRK